MADAPAAPINITVRDQNQGELHFKLKPSTKMSKIFDAYCLKKGLNVATLKFIFDGNRLNGDQTPEELEMEDGDSVDVMVEQVGGRRFPTTNLLLR